MKRYINDNVLSNNDEFSWSELNCFYKPFAIALRSFNEEYFSAFLFYIAFFMSFTENEHRTYNKQDVMFEYYDKELRDIFGIDIECIEFSNKRKMVKASEKVISEGNVIVMPVNLFLLPYSDNYLEKDHRHYVIVKGYDRKKELYYILDNMQNDFGANPKYTDFMIEYYKLYDMQKSFKRVYDANSSQCYFWKVSYINKKQSFINDGIKYFGEICKKVTNKEISLFYIEKLIIDEIENGDFHRDINRYLEIANLRILFYKLLMGYINKAKFNEDDLVKNAIDKIVTLIKNWNDIKIIILRKNVESIYGVDDLRERIEKAISINTDLLNDVNKLIVSMKEISDNSESPYFIRNRKNAKIAMQDGIVIELDKNKVFDIWNNKNDACQILSKINKDKFVFETQFLMESENAMSEAQSGVLINTHRNNKILIGQCGMLNMEIHAPYLGNEYIIYKKVFDFNKKVKIKVEYDNQNCDIHITNSEMKESINIQLTDKIKEIGVFSKSWGKCNSTAKFDYMLLDGVDLINE